MNNKIIKTGYWIVFVLFLFSSVYWAYMLFIDSYNIIRNTIYYLIIMVIFYIYSCIYIINKRKEKEIQKEEEYEREIIRITTDDIENLNPYDYEIRVAHYLSNYGFTNINTTPKSGDYGADVLAELNGKKVCVQCKMYNSKVTVGVKAVQEIYSAKAYYDCDVACIFTTSSYTPQARTMAKRLGVYLIEYR